MVRILLVACAAFGVAAGAQAQDRHYWTDAPIALADLLGKSPDEVFAITGGRDPPPLLDAVSDEGRVLVYRLFLTKKALGQFCPVKSGQAYSAGDDGVEPDLLVFVDGKLASVTPRDGPGAPLPTALFAGRGEGLPLQDGLHALAQRALAASLPLTYQLHRQACDAPPPQTMHPKKPTASDVAWFVALSPVVVPFAMIGMEGEWAAHRQQAKQATWQTEEARLIRQLAIGAPVPGGVEAYVAQHPGHIRLVASRGDYSLIATIGDPKASRAGFRFIGVRNERVEWIGRPNWSAGL